MICKSCGEIKDHHALGMCQSCYGKWRYSTNQCKFKNTISVCKICGETKICKSRGMCIKCYQRFLRGSIDEYGNKTPNKSCATYLGCDVAEKVLSKVFDDVSRAPPNNPGYDFICNKGKKIDVKSSCIDNSNKLKCRWAFGIRKNKIADFFLCVAFDNRDKLTPLHLWLIPSDKINNLTKLSISNRTLKKWSEYEMDITNTLRCCDTIKL